MLSYAAASKFTPSSGMDETFRALGIPPGIRLARLLAVMEIGACLGVTLGRSWISSLLLTCLGVSFALAGFVALRRGLDVPCACFGAGSESRLGWNQLLALPVWIAIAALPLVSQGYFQRESSMRFATLIAALLLASAAYLWRLTPSWTAMADRRVRIAGLQW